MIAPVDIDKPVPVVGRTLKSSYSTKTKIPAFVLGLTIAFLQVTTIVLVSKLIKEIIF